MRRACLIIALSALTAACAGVGVPMFREGPSPAVDRGLRFAQRACAGCHAIDGYGAGANSSAPSFLQLRLRYTSPQIERRLAAISTQGHYEMPPIFITADEAKDVAEYIESLGNR